MQVKVNNLDKSLSRAKKTLQALLEHDIYVGVKDDAELVKIAFCNEFGSFNEQTGQMNPSRPFLQQTFSGNHRRNIVNKIKKELKGVINTKNKGQRVALSALQRIADYAADECRKTIDEQNFIENAEATIKKKKHDFILVDNGALYKSIKGWIEK